MKKIIISVAVLTMLFSFSIANADIFSFDFTNLSYSDVRVIDFENSSAYIDLKVEQANMGYNYNCSYLSWRDGDSIPACFNLVQAGVDYDAAYPDVTGTSGSLRIQYSGGTDGELGYNGRPNEGDIDPYIHSSVFCHQYMLYGTGSNNAFLIERRLAPQPDYYLMVGAVDDYLPNLSQCVAGSCYGRIPLLINTSLPNEDLLMYFDINPYGDGVNNYMFASNITDSYTYVSTTNQVTYSKLLATTSFEFYCDSYYIYDEPVTYDSAADTIIWDRIDYASAYNGVNVKFTGSNLDFYVSCNNGTDWNSTSATDTNLTCPENQNSSNIIAKAVFSSSAGYITDFTIEQVDIVSGAPEAPPDYTPTGTPTLSEANLTETYSNLTLIVSGVDGAVAYEWYENGTLVQNSSSTNYTTEWITHGDYLFEVRGYNGSYYGVFGNYVYTLLKDWTPIGNPVFNITCNNNPDYPDFTEEQTILLYNVTGASNYVFYVGFTEEQDSGSDTWTTAILENGSYQLSGEVYYLDEENTRWYADEQTPAYQCMFNFSWLPYAPRGTPTISPGSGTYTTNQTLTISGVDGAAGYEWRQNGTLVQNTSSLTYPTAWSATGVFGINVVPYNGTFYGVQSSDYLYNYAPTAPAPPSNASSPYTPTGNFILDTAMWGQGDNPSRLIGIIAFIGIIALSATIISSQLKNKKAK